MSQQLGHAPPAGPSRPADGRPHTILIVEDEPRVMYMVREVLKAVGYHIVAATTGQAAVEQVALEQPDLVLLDILLPHGPNGYEVCRRIREFSDVPVIMLTAKAQEDDMLRGFDAGADDYLTKPFSAKELVARVKAVLRRADMVRRAREGRSSTPPTLPCGDLDVIASQRGNHVRDGQLVFGQLVGIEPDPHGVLGAEGHDFADSGDTGKNFFEVGLGVVAEIVAVHTAIFGDYLY